MLKGELLIWRTKNQARAPGKLQLKDSIQFASHESKLVPRKLDPGPSSKVGLMVFYCKTVFDSLCEGALINATTLATRVANWLPKFDGILFFSLGANSIY